MDVSKSRDEPVSVRDNHPNRVRILLFEATVVEGHGRFNELKTEGLICNHG